jgi:hypothetical protein
MALRTPLRHWLSVFNWPFLPLAQRKDGSFVLSVKDKNAITDIFSLRNRKEKGDQGKKILKILRMICT